MKTLMVPVSTLSQDGSSLPKEWGGLAVIQDDNLSYLVWNEATREALWVDACLEDWEILQEKTQSMLANGYRFVAVVDTHTHADHLTAASALADAARAPLVMHERAPSRRIHLRVSRSTSFATSAGSLRFLHTPGHTPDSMTVSWGPFVFTGDTLLYDDAGRDDLPGGDAVAHGESLELLRREIRADQWILPGHDGRGGRVSRWESQLKTNPSLLQSQQEFVAEAAAYRGPAPKLLKESLFENFK